MTDPARPALWQLVVEGVVSWPDPWSSHRAWVEAAFQELYVLGERPSEHELRAFLAARFPDEDARHRQQLVKLWRTRLGTPRGCPRSMRRLGHYPDGYPFAQPERLAAEHGLPNPGTLLVERVAATAERFKSSAKSGAEDQAWYELRLAVHGLAVWTATRDRVNEEAWPPTSLVVSQKGRPLEYWTREGRARGRARLERARVEAEHSPS